MVWLADCVMAGDPVEIKIAEKNSFKPTAHKSTDLFKIVLDSAVHDSRYLFFYASAPGEVDMEYTQSDGEATTHLCTGQNNVTCVFNMTEMRGHIDRPEGFRLKVKAVSNPDAEVKVGVYAGDYLILANQTRQTVLLKDVENLNVLTTFESAPDAEKIRIQLKAHPKREFAAHDAYINFDKDQFPTLAAHDYQFAHMDSFRSGFVANSGDTGFCGPAKNCSYRMYIETDGISSFQFSVVQGQAREVIETEYRYFDKSNARASRIYKLSLPDEKFKNKDIKISLISISGWPNLYVNPELVPEYSTSSIWKETGGASKSIVIPWIERNQALHKISTLYIMVQGPVQSTYYLKVQAVDNDTQVEKLASGSKEQFFTPYGNIKNFQAIVKTVAHANAKDEDLVKNQKVKVTLNAANNQVELMAYQWTPDSKRILDIELYQSQKTSPSLKGFQIGGSTHSHKEIVMDIDCNAKTAMSTTKLAGGLVEHLCVVDVGVYPMSSPVDNDGQTSPVLNANDRMGATYELSYEIAGIHTLLYANHMTVVNLMPDEERLLQFNIHELSTEGDSVGFIMQMAFGKVEMKISKTERNPCKPANSSNVYSQTAINNHFATLKFGKGGFNISNLQGSYYVCLKSQGVLSSLLVMPNPNLGVNDIFASLNSGILHLPPNQNLIGDINDVQTSLQFTFTLNLDPKQDEVIMVNVSPLQGSRNYRITATTSGYEPRSDQTFWNAVGHTLVISSRDPMFKPKAEYRVKISVPSINEYRVHGSHRFTVAYTVGLKDVLLKEGLPYVGEINNTTQKHHFRIEVPPGSKNLTILKSFVDRPYSVEGYVLARGSNDSKFIIGQNQGGHLFDEAILSKHCPDLSTKGCSVYLTAFSGSSPCGVVLAYSIDNRPFTLHHEYGYYLPQSPTSGVYKMHFVYHLPTYRDKNLTLDCENPYSTIRCYVKFAKEASDYTFPTTNSFTKLLTGEYASVDIGPHNYEDNNVMLVTVHLVPNTDVLENFEKKFHIYAFSLNGKIRVSAGPTKLLAGKPYKGKLAEKRKQYFLINHKSTENLVVNFDSAFSACRLFISKGHDAKVTTGVHLTSSFSYQEKTVVVTPQMLPMGEKITGYYTLSVQCYANATFRILYKPSSAQNYEIRLNDPVRLDLSPDEQQYVEFLNYGPAIDLEIQFRAPKASVSFYVTVFDPFKIAEADKNYDTNFKMPTLPTDEKYDFGTNWESPMQGSGKMVISKSDDKYCAFCRFVMLIKVSEPDSIELIVKKSAPSWPVKVSEGEEQFALLMKDEVAYYVVEAMRPHESVPAIIQLQKGHILIDSSSKSFVNVSHDVVTPTEVLKGHNRQAILHEEPEDKYNTAKMYLRIRAFNDSKFTINFAENLVRQKIVPSTSYQAIIAAGFTKLYTMNTQDVDSVHVSFKVTSLGTYGPDAVDDDLLKAAVSKGLVSVFVADSDIDVYLGRYFEVPAYLRIDRDRNRIEVKFMPSKRVAVIKIKNSQKFLLHYVLETATRTIAYAKPKERIVSALHNFIPAQTYTIPVPQERSVLTLDIHECVDELVVQAVFNAAGHSSESSQIMFDKYVDARRLPLNEGRGTLQLYFFMRDSFDEKAQLSFVPAKARTHTTSTVFSFTYDITEEGDPDTIGIERFKIRNEAGEVQVQDLSGDVAVKKVMIEDLDGILKTHNVKITYSLVLARNSKMLNHLVRCGKYGITDAKQVFNSNDYYVFNTYEHISAISVAEQKRKAAESQYLKVDALNEIMISPSMYSFGDRYEAAVIARILVYGKEETRTFPDGQEFTLVYERFIYGGNTAGFTLTAVMVLIVLLFVMALLWQCVKRGLFRPLMRRGWFSSFNLDSIADQLVLEVSDYTKAKKKLTDDSVITLGSPADSRDLSALDQSISTDAKADETL